MGIVLVGKVLDRWSHLHDLQFRALARMALTALDEPAGEYPAALYWGGRELIARSWRGPWPEGDTEDERRRRRNILNEVSCVCRKLRAAGAIEIAAGPRPPGPGMNRMFWLTLDGERRFPVPPALAAGGYTRDEIGDRDRWLCGICLEPVDKALKYPDKRSPSLDHIIPRGRGGEDVRDNVRITHWICNTQRGLQMYGHVRD